MKTYHISLHARLFSINRVVQANSYAEAAESVAEYMPVLRCIWIEDITGQEFED